MFRIGLKIAGIFIAFIFCLVAFGFLMSALYLYFAALFHSAMSAALASGLVLLGVVLLILLLVKLVGKKRQPKKEINFDFDLNSLLKRYPKKGLLASLAMGFFVGISPSMRKMLMENIALLLKENFINAFTKDSDQDKEDT